MDGDRGIPNEINYTLIETNGKYKSMLQCTYV